MTRDLLERCRAQIPGHNELTAGLVEVEARRRAINPEHDTTVIDAANAVLDLISAGGRLPSDLGQRVARERARIRSGNDECQLLEHLRERLVIRVAHARSTGVDVALDVLRDEHDQLVREARGVLAELAGVNDADEARSAGVAEQWHALGELAAAHRDLRRVQIQVVSDYFDTRFRPDSMQTADARARDLVATFGTARQVPGLTETRVQVNDMVTKPGLARALPWTTTDERVNLRTVIAADSWVPAMAELLAAEQSSDEPSQLPEPPGAQPLEVPSAALRTRGGLRTGQPLMTESRIDPPAAR